MKSKPGLRFSALYFVKGLAAMLQTMHSNVHHYFKRNKKQQSSNRRAQYKRQKAAKYNDDMHDDDPAIREKHKKPTIYVPIHLSTYTAKKKVRKFSTKKGSP